MSNKMKSRKLWLSVAASILPVLSRAIWPDIETEVIIVAVLGAIAGILGISLEDVAKQKVAAVEAASSPAKKPSKK